jgi:plasmid replication initiation protein
MSNLPLIKEKHPQQDLFICDVADAILKDIMPHMEHPFYSLSKTPVRTVREYRNGENWVKITPSIHGLPTIYDKDILIYAISQIMAKRNKGEQISKRVQINTSDLLIFTNKGTGGKDYKAFEQSLERLRGATISTNIKSGDVVKTDFFGLIDSASMERKYGLDGRLIAVSVTLSDWVFNAIEAQQVLTLHRDYFRLRKPIERRVYEIARKHCGQQNEWTIGIEKLHLKTGSQSNIREFRRAIKNLAETNHLPDYIVVFDQTTGKITFYNRRNWWDEEDKPYPQIQEPQTYVTAKALCPQGTDIYAIEQEWFKYWKSKGRQELKNPDRSFLGFVSKKFLSDD